MARNFVACDRDQELLLPPSLRAIRCPTPATRPLSLLARDPSATASSPTSPPQNAWEVLAVHVPLNGRTPGDAWGTEGVKYEVNIARHDARVTEVVFSTAWSPPYL